MNDAELPDGGLPGRDDVDHGNTDEDEEIDLEDTLEWRGDPDGPRPA